jgi:8-oxo-dGTP pyrophosphatase MutT (NUDIX family)
VYARRSARVVLVDPAHRVLLLRSRFRRSVAGVEWAWFVHGGGVEGGESIQTTAVRELAEETGVVAQPTDLVHLAFCGGQGRVGDVVGLMRDDIFVSLVSSASPSRDGMEPHEREAFGVYRWSALDGLAVTTETIFSTGLAEALRDYVATKVP